MRRKSRRLLPAGSPRRSREGEPETPTGEAETPPVEDVEPDEDVEEDETTPDDEEAELDSFESSKIGKAGKQFNTAKESANRYNPAESQDAVAFDETTGRYALADGVSKSIMPHLFARGLVNKFIRQPIANWDQWTGSIRDAWQRWMVRYTQSPNPKMFVTGPFVAGEGAMSTFVGIQFSADGTWEANVLGDSALFKISNQKIVESMELVKRGRRTDAIGSRPGQDGTPETVNGKVEQGDVYLLTSDALGDWLVQMERAGRMDEALSKLENANSEAEFQKFIDEAENDADIPLQNDDQSILWIDGDKAVQEVSSKSQTKPRHGVRNGIRNAAGRGR